MGQTLREYQQRGVDQALEAYRAGAKRVLIVLPTGGGKTTIFCHMTKKVSEVGGSSLIVVHRRELATQATNRLREWNLPFGFIMAGERPKPSALIQVASVQTLVRRQCPPAKFIVCDEAHLSTADTWHSVLSQYPNARILGVTATPWRLSGKPLAGSYDECIVVSTPRELKELGFLCPYVGFSYKTPDLSEVKTTGGDYNGEQAGKAMSDSLIVDNVVEEWGKHASELSTVVFAVTVEHSKQLMARFRAAGVAAEHLDGQTSLEARKGILRRVESGATKVLCNVGVAVEGLDIPRLKCCVLARPTKSMARAIQMMGRVRRPWNGVTARIHDHAFVIKQHGLPDDDRDFTLNAKPEMPPSLSTCEECFALFTGPACPACNHQNARQESEAREIQTVADGEKFEFTSETSTEEAMSEPGEPVRVRWDKVGRIVEGVFEKRWEEREQFGLQKKYLISGSKRSHVLPGTARLDQLMAKVALGSRVRITRLEDLDLGGFKKKKMFRVEVDDGA